MGDDTGSSIEAHATIRLDPGLNIANSTITESADISGAAAIPGSTIAGHVGPSSMGNDTHIRDSVVDKKTNVQHSTIQFTHVASNEDMLVGGALAGTGSVIDSNATGVSDTQRAEIWGRVLSGSNITPFNGTPSYIGDDALVEGSSVAGGHLDKNSRVSGSKLSNVFMEVRLGIGGSTIRNSTVSNAHVNPGLYINTTNGSVLSFSDSNPNNLHLIGTSWQDGRDMGFFGSLAPMRGDPQQAPKAPAGPGSVAPTN